MDGVEILILAVIVMFGGFFNQPQELKETDKELIQALPSFQTKENNNSWSIYQKNGKWFLLVKKTTTTKQESKDSKDSFIQLPDGSWLDTNI